MSIRGFSKLLYVNVLIIYMWCMLHCNKWCVLSHWDNVYIYDCNHMILFERRGEKGRRGAKYRRNYVFSSLFSVSIFMAKFQIFSWIWYLRKTKIGNIISRAVLICGPVSYKAPSAYFWLMLFYELWPSSDCCWCIGLLF